jgi:hypothetical protein
LRKIALLRCHNILAVTVESSSFKSSGTFDNPGKTCSSFLMTLSGVLPVTYTQEHMVFEAIPAITGGKLTNTYSSKIRTSVRRMYKKAFRYFFMR